jgi:prophage antirepressor-like protein
MFRCRASRKANHPVSKKKRRWSPRPSALSPPRALQAHRFVICTRPMNQGTDPVKSPATVRIERLFIMSIQHALKVFEYEDKRPFRIIDRNGEPWFVLGDVCRELEIANPRDAASRLDDDEKDGVGITDAIGRSQRQTIINESGLYSLILRSTKPEAKRFKKWVTSEVLPSIRKTGGYGSNTPAFIRRYNQNWDRVSANYFSVINELAVRLWGRFEHLGHIMADTAKDGRELRPDISVGRGFSDWLKAKHPDVADTYAMYLHWTAAKEIEARQYPMTMMALFHDYLDNVWIPNNAEDYFNRRDPAALPHIGHLLPTSRPAPRFPRGA